MALSEAGGASSRVLSFPAGGSAADDGRRRAEFNRLDAQAQALKDFVASLNALSECARAGAEAADVMEALDKALGCVIEATCANDGALLVKDDATGDLVFTLVQGATPQRKLLWSRVPEGQGVAHWVAANRSPAIVNNALTDERFYNGMDVANRFRTRTIIAAPLMSGDEVLGVLEVLNKRNDEYFCLNDQHHLTLLAHLAAVLLAGLRDRQ